MQKSSDAAKSVGYIDVRVFAHATENTEKVQAATRNLFPEALQETLLFQKTALTGHHANPIILFTAKLTERSLLPSALEKLGAGLSTIDKTQLNEDIDLHLDKSNLYLRFDKQAAYLGAIKFTQTDPIHLKVHFKDKTAQQIIEISKQAGLLP
jgi:RNA binding exosome subunit